MALPWLFELDGVKVIRPGQDFVELDVDAGHDPQEILSVAIARGERVTQFLIADPSIEQIFIDRVGRPPSEDHHLAAIGAPSGNAGGSSGIAGGSSGAAPTTDTGSETAESTR